MNCKFRRFLGIILGLLLWAGPLAARDVRVIRVIDGDTVVLASGYHLRYAGINAPELHTRFGSPEPFARKAFLRNRQLVEGKRLRFEPAERRKDRYGRLLGYLFLPDGRLVSEVLVSEGLAMVCYYPGASRYYRKLLAIQRRALREERGLFGTLDRGRGPYIGNIRSRRFHRKDCPEARHIRRRRIFKSLREAFWAGYCPARGCRPWPP
ncbi:thermonuclease family protein [Thermosulfurimonas sp. F29]|uniref:thermonuclease family protein n=1 Tax=Thermosulfurimonas sp. F29 TaxID=2867247 RepID=UPI001C840363|nr:thermonuclease family protein [Thermosulfurimonas sp. F29]MBX6422473.1 thermonuclease family protein [Thermosulfurimonas sp. F29]